MVKKVLRWVAILSPVLFVLPMFLGMWAVQTTLGNNVSTGDPIGIFSNLQNLKDAYGESFKSVWLTLFTVFAVIALVVSVVVTVLYLLNDLKITKANKFERVASFVLVVVSVLAVVFGIISVTANAELSVTGITSITKLVPLAGMWVFYFGAPILSILALVTANPKASSKKRRKK